MEPPEVKISASKCSRAVGKESRGERRSDN